ncbi:DNA-binding transcriptional regulator, PucR family [Saccharopolyspora antimicrobica]|uniref:DNA-binding PucR family transcriptional regulator n=1 Tax=Saccharopolyspora antimicrobica TaxID=455193 RepID=A0A1I4T187_9PSEU|nr:helix-turn-helix domain-containing protein [Saccharopolyspora antimicrobica]RKT85918.1 DNA-binding PucR family transcriptional regulator [Saccharopolyspora antimicrobica]SFM70421.1 DNA-binding transcriptional regulator, PucR family [Saccharopolyspora antimicrobica]
MLVDDLLNLPELDLRVRVRGRVDRPIRWVHTIEIESPGRFLRGGEVVLTAGVWRTAGITAEAFVADLVAADVAAVGFGLVPPETQVPEEFVAAAREHGLTCFVVPVEVAFLQIVEAFVSTKRAEWERPLRRHLAQHDAIVAALRVDRGVGTVVGALAKQLGEPVAVRVAGALAAGETPTPNHPLPLVGEGLAEAELLLPRPLGELDVEQQAAVVQAMPFIALEIERTRAVRATELRYAWELFEWVHSGAVGIETVRTRLHSLGLPPDGPIAAVVVRTASPDAVALRLGDLLGTDGVAAQRGSDVVAFARVADSAADLARRIHDSLGSDVHVGVGKPGSASELRVSLLQATHAAEAVSSRTGRGWMTHEQLSSPALLLSVQDPELLAATSRTLLGPVLDHDERRGSDLVPSLEVYLDAGGRWQEAAQRLHVHINTLRHRMSRVEELTGRSLSSTADRVDLFLALRALRRS